MQFIDLKAQQDRIRPQLDAAISKVLGHGQYIMGPEVAELEGRLAEFVGARHAIGCSSGTDALLLGLMAYGVGPGDAIFTTPFTFFATCEMIALTGATPIFVDIDPVTFNMDPLKLAAAIRDLTAQAASGGRPSLKPKGIIPVDLFGLPADYVGIMSIAEQYGLFVLEDAAQAFGASYHGCLAPALAHIGTTSFFPAKPLGCYGDGGAVFTDDDALAETMRSLMVHGKGADKYNNVRIGLNARLDTLQAAILIEKMQIYPEEIERRQQVAARYSEAFQQGGAELQLPQVPTGSQSVWAQYTIRCSRRDEVQAKLRQWGVPSMIYYEKPMHLLAALDYLGYAEGDFPEAEAAAKTVLSLPFHPYLAQSDIQQIVNQTLRAIE